MTLRGIFFLLFALLVFTVQDAVVKYLTERHAVLQILTWRILIVVCILGCIAKYKLGWRFLKTDRRTLMFLRGFLAFAAFTNYYFALSYLPLADAATVYMTAPLFVTALSVPMLGEQVGIRRWIAITIGFAAVVYMLNPGSGIFQPIAALPLASALFYSFIPIVTRLFDSRDHTLTIVFYTALSYAIFCLAASTLVHLWPAIPNDHGIWATIAQPWNTMNTNAWLLTLLSSVLFTAGIVCITTAYRLAQASVLAPFEYSYLIWATLIGYVVFSDIPTLRTWIAGLLIAGSGVYIAIREHRAAGVIKAKLT